MTHRPRRTAHPAKLATFYAVLFSCWGAALACAVAGLARGTIRPLIGAYLLAALALLVLAGAAGLSGDLRCKVD